MAEDQPQDQTPAQPADAKEKGLGLSSYGNAAGDKISSTLAPVGKPLGKGLETAAAPLGSIVGSVVDNGIMAGGRAAGAISGKGAGAMDTEGMGGAFKDLQAKKAEEAEMREPVGGKEQTAGNPLGL